ncbi:tetratricopeptide repeat protein [Flagellimonas meishanensis]|uniref:tetratricopeptide repeat protein n=1 Tax=Flagellimonas meishanensis TaxID=2873264 RepID=UPI001CA6F53D|nr:tetratricopeptide repeat protein [[Muricauda] meishanensis]
MKTSKLLVFLVCSFCFCAIAQENKKLDSLLSVYKGQKEDTLKVKTLHQLFLELRHKDWGKAYEYNEESILLSKKLIYPKGEGIGYLNKGYYYRFLPNIDSARFYFEKSVKLLGDINVKQEQWKSLNEYATFETLAGNFERAISLAHDGQEIAIALNSGTKLIDNLQRKATIYMDIGDYEMAMRETLKAAKIADTLSPPDLKRKAISVADIGRIEMLRGNYNKALEPIKQALDIFRKLKDDQWLATLYVEIGNVYWYMEKYDESYKNYNNSLEISRKMNRDDFIASNLNNLALVSMERKQYDKAITHLLEANRLQKRVGSVNNKINNHNNLGAAYFEIGNYKNSIAYHSIAIKLADSIRAIDVLRDGYFGRSLAFEGLGDFKNALSDQRNYQKVNDSVFNTRKAKQIDELKTQYETEKKEQQIALQEKEITLLEQEAAISNLQKLLLGIGLLLSLLGFYAIRQKMKRNKLEKEKVDVELAFKKKELTTHALHLAKKNEVLEGLKQKAQELKEKEESKNGYQQLIRTINFDLQDDNNWENFSRYFEEVHKDFHSNVKSKYPEVTSNELRLLALLKMNLSSKEIANILNISPEGIKKARYRLRKKLDLTTDDSLQDLVLSL